MFGYQAARGIARHSGIDLDQDLNAQRKVWRFQRAGWIILSLLLFAAVLGFLGDGPFSKAEVASRDGALRIEYPRFAYRNAPMEMVVHVSSDEATGGVLQLSVSRPYLREMKIQAVTPEAIAVDSREDSIFYGFGRSTGETPLEVTFHLEPQGYGLVRGTIALERGETVSFHQFIYP